MCAPWGSLEHSSCRSPEREVSQPDSGIGAHGRRWRRAHRARIRMAIRFCGRSNSGRRVKAPCCERASQSWMPSSHLPFVAIRWRVRGRSISPATLFSAPCCTQRPFRGPELGIIRTARPALELYRDRQARVSSQNRPFASAHVCCLNPALIVSTCARVSILLSTLGYY